MRIAILSLLLASAPTAAQDSAPKEPTAPELVKTFVDTHAKAKTLRMKGSMKFTLKDGAGSAEIEFLRKEGNRYRRKVKGTASGESFEGTRICDGKNVAHLTLPDEKDGTFVRSASDDEAATQLRYLLYHGEPWFPDRDDAKKADYTFEPDEHAGTSVIKVVKATWTKGQSDWVLTLRFKSEAMSLVSMTRSGPDKQVVEITWTEDSRDVELDDALFKF